MALTYDSIATNTLGADAASVTFSSISASFTDLVLVITSNTTGSAGDDDLYMQFNGDTTTNYSWTRLFGNGTTATSSRGTGTTFCRIGNSAGTSATSTFPVTIVQIMNYANTTTFKTILSRGNNSAVAAETLVSLWRKTPEAINSIKVYPQTTNFKTGSTFTLYGIKAA